MSQYARYGSAGLSSSAADGPGRGQTGPRAYVSRTESSVSLKYSALEGTSPQHARGKLRERFGWRGGVNVGVCEGLGVGGIDGIALVGLGVGILVGLTVWKRHGEGRRATTPEAASGEGDGGAVGEKVAVGNGSRRRCRWVERDGGPGGWERRSARATRSARSTACGRTRRRSSYAECSPPSNRRMRSPSKAVGCRQRTSGCTW